MMQCDGDLLGKRHDDMKKYLGIIILIGVCVALRLLPHSPNVAPVTAFALFAGYVWGWRTSMVATLAVVALSDVVLGFYEWQVVAAVYGSYLCIGFIGYRFNQREKSAAKGVFLVWVGSLIFFVLTNGAVWAFSPWYQKTLSGLLQAYINGLPFLRNSLLGDMGYFFLLAGGYALYQARAPVWRTGRRLLRSFITPHIKSSSYVNHH